MRGKARGQAKGEWDGSKEQVPWNFPNALMSPDFSGSSLLGERVAALIRVLELWKPGVHCEEGAFPALLGRENGSLCKVFWLRISSLVKQVGGWQLVEGWRVDRRSGVTAVSYSVGSLERSSSKAWEGVWARQEKASYMFQSSCTRDRRANFLKAWILEPDK